MKHLIQSLKIGAIAAPVLLLAGMATLQAGDAKTYPGSMGVKWSGGTPVYSTSAIGNSSSSQWLYIDLPVINDDMSNGIQSSWVKVLDRHYNSNVRCSINSAYWNNTYDQFYGSWGGNRYSTGSSNNAQTLSTGGATGGSSRHEYFSCAIPPTYSGNRSYIISYYVNEG